MIFSHGENDRKGREAGIMIRNACRLLATALAISCAASCASTGPDRETERSDARVFRVALVQFDAVPEEPGRNLQEMERLMREAVGKGARWIMFHEGTLTDYTPRLEELAEEVPDGPACRRMARLARELNCQVSFGLSERAEARYFLTQVFMGPDGLVHRYRKTWLWREPGDEGYRNEWIRYDPGTGPELFSRDGVDATCMICADGEAPRCVERVQAMKPQLVFYPNNRARLPDLPVFGARAARIGTPVLVTNRVGSSWGHDCMGGCAVYGPGGSVVAEANRDGREEILYHDLFIPAR
jgi:predicted amidohydrolase